MTQGVLELPNQSLLTRQNAPPAIVSVKMVLFLVRAFERLYSKHFYKRCYTAGKVTVLSRW